MQKPIVLRAYILCLLLLPALVSAQVRTKTNFGSSWHFLRLNDSSSVEELISIPHTSRLEDLVVVKQFQGKSSYEKSFICTPSKSQKVFLYFEGVMSEATVFINGTAIKQHEGGYLPFTVDITSALQRRGKNVVKVVVSNANNPEIPPGKPLEDLDFNYYGGIYRNVYLITTNALYITDPVAANETGGGGIFIDFNKVSIAQASGILQVHLRNDFATVKKTCIKTRILYLGTEVATFISETVSIPSGAANTFRQSISLSQPYLWSTTKPALYSAVIEVYANGRLVDQEEQRFGIRSAELRADGFYLNQQRMYLSGTNRHQEYPYVGYALSNEAQYRDAVKIKNAGFDFVRLSHYPQAEAFLDACDELGIVVMNSLPGWQFFGDSTFQANSLQNLRDMIRRDRNHPSILFWENSLNETEMTESFMLRANEVLDSEFPFSERISCSWIDHSSYNLYIPARQHGSIPNYWTTYQKGTRKVFIAEYGDWEYYAQNAGFHQKQFANLTPEERTSRQLREAGEKRLLQQALNFQEAANSNRRGIHTIGEANWLMFDYNRGYSPDIESSGISDIFRIPKFAHAFYQSQRPADSLPIPKVSSGPMVHIASYWTPLSATDIKIYSNCETVALYINDTLVGKQPPTVDQQSDRLAHPPFVFHLNRFIPGTLRAEGLVGDKIVAQTSVHTPQEAALLSLSVDLSSVPLASTTTDIVFVHATVTDEQGTLVPDNNAEIHFSVEGPGKLIGNNPVRANAGIATLLLQTTPGTAPIVIRATANGLTSDSFVLSR